MSIEYATATEEERVKLISVTRANLNKLVTDRIQTSFSFRRFLERDWLDLSVRKGVGKLTLFPWFAITKPTFEVIQYENGKLTSEKRQMITEDDARDRLFTDKNFLPIPKTRKTITPEEIDLDSFKNAQLVIFAKTVESNLKTKPAEAE
ncbi:MAG: hypothetical protein US48_C0040G0002 [Candidatus Levybacteria bacterium GW2011_GWA2_37_36]|nr:MAG: hypothetical protein US43_C0019G0002 [Candidatus Levybacteria bacterium GW2011_GWA1_37_16]KKQ31960.1 MAG: hypothetical protein US48_C0040G0002 [Candidatus Levybacteria bacterium GW2011_GWA2_37_36]KKQ37159.1 MAG: hypothetical protein US55_C0040G0014 [Candidatus Levybacteria bacterium GW2011_GWC2_37_7]KKQ41466.1 MAG: hypothetical protein US59_C0031G0007 [Candidatus Levybacteria bacterium GW2011_GWB1_37_8]OGH51285.1 MAG: hypothetical protein A3H17_01425 [Candidatus Levybacteria bacterium R